MSNNVKQILILLFVVSTLLLMIGSVSAIDIDELNDNLETSVIVDDDLSINDADSISNPNDKVSNQFTTNDDETVGIVENVNEKDLKNLDSRNVVSNKEYATIDAKDSESSLAENHLGTTSFYISKTALTPVVKVGDDVYFEIFVQNDDWYNWQTYYGSINVQDWFDDSELEYIDFTPNPGPDGNAYESLYSESVLEDEWGKRIQISYNGWYGFQVGYSFNFTVHFKALKEGELKNSAQIWWLDNNWQSHEVWAYSSVLVGEPGLNLTKTAQEKVVKLNDDVYFEIYLENNGTLPYTDQYIYINDWFDEGLEYVDYTVNPDENGNLWEQNYVFAGLVEDETYGNRLVVMYNAYNNWVPGSSLNFTVHFKATKNGVLNNHAQVWWKWKSWGEDDNHEWIEEWGNDSVIVGEPKFTLEKISNYESVKVGDLVSFTIIYTNTGTLNLTGVYITDNEYTNGIVYYDYSDKDSWTFDGTDTWYYNYELEPGESASLELTFQATTAGEKNNTATAGHNVTNETLNSTDTVLVVDEDSDTPEDPDEIDEDEDPDEIDEEDDSQNNETSQSNKIIKAVSIPVVGNPLFILLISLISLCFVPLRFKK